MRRLLPLLLAVVAPAAAAQTPALGPEFPVNTYTTGAQTAPAVAAADSGGFVLAWESLNQDGSQLGVFARVFGADGAPLSGEIPVNTHTTSNQREPSVAADDAGNFVVVWRGSGQDGSGDGIFGQRFDADGVPAGAEFQVNTFTTSSQEVPAVSMNGTGEFVAVWQSFAGDANGFGIAGRRFDAAGAAQGPEFQVNAHTTGNQERPRVAIDASGGFVVVWDTPGQDGNFLGVFGRRFDASGVAVSSEFSVNTYTTGDQAAPDVAIGSDGRFAVVWRSAAQDGSELGVFARRYDAANVPVGGEFPV
ncbi:MAG TPA: RTX toxin, partial [Thermoanaerobaculia bacterium]